MIACLYGLYATVINLKKNTEKTNKIFRHNVMMMNNSNIHLYLIQSNNGMIYSDNC